MQSLIAVTAQATDLTLLTEAELRQATAVATGRDAQLLALGRRVAAAITSFCNVRAAGATPPTLRLETITETFRLDRPADGIILARRPVVEIVSVTEDAVAVDAPDYEMDAGAGLLRRLCSDYPAWWQACKIVVVYRAGWSTVPDNLRNAAMKLTAVFWSEGQKVDPSLKAISVPGVIDKEYWVGPSDDPAIPREVADLLGDYINTVVG